MIFFNSLTKKGKYFGRKKILATNLNQSQKSLNTIASNLRGGGCGVSKTKNQISEAILLLPRNYYQKMKQNCNVLLEKSEQLLDNFSRNEIMMSLQWFQHNRHWICEICKNDNLIVKLFDSAQNSFKQLLSVVQVYLKGSGCICYFVLEVCNDLLLIIYTYLLNNDNRFISVGLHSELLEIVDQIKQDLEVHKNFWTNGLNFQLTMIKIALMNSRTDSKEQQEKLIKIATTGISSLLSLSISEDFTNALFDFAKYFLNEKYNELQFPIQTYQIYYFFFLLKGSIIKNIQCKKPINDLIASLQIGYEQYVKNSDNWIVHFCWINSFSDLISHRLIISKTESFKGIDIIKQKQLWNQLITQNFIQVLSYDKSLALVNNNISSQQIDQESVQILNNFGFSKLILLQQVLLSQKFCNKQNFFQFYNDFKFGKQNSSQENTGQQNQILEVDEQMKKLQLINPLLKGFLEAIKEQQLGFTNSFILLIEYENQNFLEYQLNIDKFKESKQELNQTLVKFSYLLFEIDFIIKIEKKRIDICQDYLFKLLIKDKNKQKDMIQENAREIDSIQQDWISYLKNIPAHFIETFCQMIRFERIIQNSSSSNKNQLEQIKIQIQDDQKTSFLHKASIILEKFIEKLNVQQLKLQNFWKINSKFVMEQNEIEIDQKIIDFILQLIHLDTIQFINLEDIIIFSTNLKKQLNTLEDLQIFDEKIQNNIKIIRIYKAQLIHKVYIFSRLEFNLKLKINETQNSSTQIDLQTNSSSLNLKNLIEQQQIEILKLLEDYSKDKTVIEKLFHIAITTRDQIIKRFSQKQNEQVNLALLFQIQLYNFLYKFKLSSQNDINQLKQEIVECYNQFKKGKQNQFDQKELSQEKQNFYDEDLKEFQKLLLQQIKEWNQQIEKISNLLKKLEVVSQFVDSNFLGLIYQKEQTFNKILDNFNEIIQELIIQQELHKIFEEFIMDIQNKSKTQIFELKLKKIFQPNDFATIFCYDYVSPDQNLETEKDYQEILDSLGQDLIVNRKFYDLSKDYIVRECLLFNLIKIQSQVHEKELKQICQEQIKQIWIIEKDQSVRALLKNKEMVEMQKILFSHDLKSFSTSIKEEMNQKLKDMKAIEQQIRFEGNQSNKEMLEKQLTIKYEEFDEYLNNISDMSQQLDITLIFLKEMYKNLNLIKQKIDDLQESINSIGNDVRKLRGKTYLELFKIRKEKVLKQSYLFDLDSIYIPLKTKEINPITGQNQETNSGSSFSNLLVDGIKQNIQDEEKTEGEVNQFIYEEGNKDVMLIKGQAGSGKSRAARKIEQYLWEQNKDEKDWIPLYISLPQLKNPKFNLLDQALESENYGFDKFQLKDFKEAIQNQKIRIVMILDSYDEMKQDCIQSNLISTNRFIQDFALSSKNEIRYVKFVITSRLEILTSLGYQTWFLGESIHSFKEVEILNFNQDQSESYLYNYVKLSIKRRIKYLYDLVKQIKQEQFEVLEFLEIWKKINDQILNKGKDVDDDSSQLLYDSEIENILQLLKKCSAFQFVQEDQLIILKKELKALWSVNLYKQTIQNLKIQHFLQTPFMLEIVVQTLPSLSKKYKGSNDIKEIFQKNFLLLKKQDNLSKKQLKKYSFKNKIKEEIQITQQQIQKEQLEIEEENQQNLKSLQLILEQLEDQRFFESYSITDIKIAENQIKNLKQNDDLKFIIPALQMQIFTVYEFYQNFIEFYHDQQIQKLRQLGKVENIDSFTIDIIQFSESLALEMTMKQLTQVNYQQKGRLKLKNHYFDKNDEDNWKMQYFDNLEDDYVKLVRSSALITLKGNSYSFNHKSLQEFYVAKHINNLIEKLELRNNNLSDESKIYFQKSIFNENQFNISQENYAGTLSILKQKLKIDNDINNKLISMAKLGNNKSFKNASSNSFCLLSHLQIYLGEQDFSEIEIEKTTLRGLSFYKSNFKNSILKDVFIDSCLFDEADLENAKWMNVICSEKPTLKGHKGNITIIQYLNNNKYIITGDSEKIVIFWDVNTYDKVKEINDISGVPKLIALLADDSMLFIAEDTNIIESWLINDINNIRKSEHIIHKNISIIQLQIYQNENQLMVIDSNGILQCWDINLIKMYSNQKDGFILQCSTKIKFIEFFSNGNMLASGTENQQIILWNVEQQNKIAVINVLFPINQLAINKSSSFLYCISDQQNLAIWNIQNIHQPELILNSTKYDIQNILLTPDDKAIIYCSHFDLLMQNTNDICNQEEYYQINNCTCIAFSPDNNLVASVINEQLLLWDLQTQIIINYIEHNDSIILSLIFICKGQKLLSGHYPRILKLWSIEKCELITIIYDCNFESYKFSVSYNSDLITLPYYDEKEQIAIKKLNPIKSKNLDISLENSTCQSVSFDDQFILSYSIILNIKNEEPIQFENHENQFLIGQFSQYSPLFASFSKDYKIRIWAYSGVIFNQQIESKLDDKICNLAFSFNDKYLAFVIEGNKFIYIWEFGQQKWYKLQESIDINSDICFSFDNQKLVFYNNNEIKIWTFSSDNLVLMFKDDDSSIQAIASSPILNLFATSSNFKELYIKFWDFETRQLLHKISIDKQITFLVFSHDGNYFISAENKIKLWDLTNFPQIKLIAHSHPQQLDIHHIFFLHKTQGIIIQPWNYCMNILEFSDFEYLGLLEQSEGLNTKCDFSDDSKHIVGGIDQQVVIWNIQFNYEIEFKFIFSDKIKSVKYCQNQSRLLIALTSVLYLLDIKSDSRIEIRQNFESLEFASTFFDDQYIYTIQQKQLKVWKLAHEDQVSLIDIYQIDNNYVIQQIGKYMATYNYSKKSMIIYNIQLNSKFKFINQQHEYIDRIKISNDQRYILYGNNSNCILLDFESNVIIEEFHQIDVIEFCPDNCNLILIRNDEMIIQNINDKNLQKKYRFNKKQFPSICLLFSNNNKNLILASQNNIHLYNIEDIFKAQFILEFESFKYGNNLHKASPKYLASIINEKQIKLSDMINRKLIRQQYISYNNITNAIIFFNNQKIAYNSNSFIDVKTFSNNQNVFIHQLQSEETIFAVSNNQKYCVFSDQNSIYVCEQDSNSEELLIQSFNQLDEEITFYNLSFSSDTKFLIGCGSNKIIYIWDFKARKVIAKFQGHSDNINVAQISSDNSTLASGSNDKLIRLWNLQVDFNRITSEGHKEIINHLQFSADSLILYSASQDQTFKTWDMQKKMFLSSKEFDRNPSSFSISQKNQEKIFITQVYVVQLWQIQQSQTMYKSNFEIYPNTCYSENFFLKAKLKQIQFLSNEDILITLSINDYEEDERKEQFSIVEIWDTKQKQPEKKFYQYAQIQIQQYQISVDGKYICSLDQQNELTLGHDQNNGKYQKVEQLKQYHENKIINFAFSNNCKILSSFDKDYIIFRNLEDDQLICKLQMDIEPELFFQFFTNDDKYYCMHSQNKIFLWNIDHLIKDYQKFEISEIKLEQEILYIQCFTISNNLKQLIIGINNNQKRFTLRVIDIKQDKQLQNIDQNSQLNQLQFSDDDLLLGVVNELNEIIIYDTEQYVLKNVLKCHQNQIIMIKFFFEVKTEMVENSNQNQQNNQEEKLIRNVGIASFDKNYTLVINSLEEQIIQKQSIQLQTTEKGEILQIFMGNSWEKLGLITQNDQNDCILRIFTWQFDSYQQKNIKYCTIVYYDDDDHYLLYGTMNAKLIAIQLEDYESYSRDGKEIFNNLKSEKPFNYLEMNKQNSVLYAGNEEEIICFQFFIVNNQIQLIQLKIIDINNLKISKIMLRKESQIYCLGNNKIYNLNFSNSIGKLKSCLTHQDYSNFFYFDDGKNFQFQNCSFSSDFQLCGSCVSKWKIHQLSNQIKKQEYEQLSFIILWNLKTLKYRVLNKPPTKSYFEESIIYHKFNDVVVFFPKQKTFISTEVDQMIFWDFQDFDSKDLDLITQITTLNHFKRIINLMISKDEKWLSSICDIGIFNLWNISNLQKIYLKSVFSFYQDINGFKFTNDTFCYSLIPPIQKFNNQNQNNGCSKKQNFIVEEIDLKICSDKATYIPYSQNINFSIMSNFSVIAFSGINLQLWNYKTNEKLIILDDNENQSYNQVVFGYNNNLLAVVVNCDILLFNIQVDPLQASEFKKLEGHEDIIECIQILHDDSIIISSSKDNTIRFWSLISFIQIAQLDDLIEPISKIAISPNCIDMAIAMSDGSIKLYKLQFPKNIHYQNSNQNNNQQNYVSCYKIFGRYNLISAKNCILKNTTIEQDKKNLETLFIQKAAIKLNN